MSKIVGVVSAAVGLAFAGTLLPLVKSYADTIVNENDPRPLIPPASKRVATRAEPIIPVITPKQRAEQKAFIARQQKLTREQLVGRFGL